jgi:hypothetical protein
MTTSADSIPHEVRKAFSDQGIKLDMLGQKLNVGDQILVKGYGSPVHNNIATVKKINKVNLAVDVEAHYFDYDAHRKWCSLNPGVNYWKVGVSFRKKELKTMARNPADVIKFDKQVASARAEYEALEEAYPEMFI